MHIERLAEIIQENHIDVVQRIKALEVQSTGIPERVAVLEHFKYTLLGANAILSTAAAGLFAWFHKH